VGTSCPHGNSIVGGQRVAHPTNYLIERDKLLPETHHLLQILARFRVGELRAQLVVHGGCGHAVDGGDRGVALFHRAGEGAQHVARAGVVGGDHAVLARHRVGHFIQLIESQQ